MITLYFKNTLTMVFDGSDIATQTFFDKTHYVLGLSHNLEEVVAFFATSQAEWELTLPRLPQMPARKMPSAKPASVTEHAPLLEKENSLTAEPKKILAREPAPKKEEIVRTPAEIEHERKQQLLSLTFLLSKIMSPTNKGRVLSNATFIAYYVKNKAVDTILDVIGTLPQQQQANILAAKTVVQTFADAGKINAIADLIHNLLDDKRVKVFANPETLAIFAHSGKQDAAAKMISQMTKDRRFELLSTPGVRAACEQWLLPKQLDNLMKDLSDAQKQTIQTAPETAETPVLPRGYQGMFNLRTARA